MEITKIKAELKRRHDAGKVSGDDRFYLDTLEAITDLEAELALHRRIPVTERLPEESGAYQVLRVENPYPTTREYFAEDKSWGSTATITHWWPIILPAKDGDNG